jgi:hypothetical protein
MATPFPRNASDASAQRTIPINSAVSSDGKTVVPKGYVNEVLNIDSGDSLIFYVGIAEPGQATSAAVWQIKRMTVTEVVGIFDALVVEWADGDDLPNKVYDDRESLSYS